MGLRSDGRVDGEGVLPPYAGGRAPGSPAAPGAPGARRPTPGRPEAPDGRGGIRFCTVKQEVRGCCTEQ
ncbi:hypothetical protein GCM10028832_38690 [Streptomyces sparsus]